MTVTTKPYYYKYSIFSLWNLIGESLGSARGVGNNTGSGLLYKNEHGWNNIPEWALFYKELGDLATRYTTGPNCTVIALAIPTRSFVSAFCSLGTIRKYLLEKETLSSDILSKITELKEGDLLNYKDPVDGWVTVSFTKMVQDYGQKFIKFRRQEKKGFKFIVRPLDIMIPQSKFSLLSIPTENLDEMSELSVGSKISVSTEFLSSFIGKAGSSNPISATKCAIIGVVSNLRRETTEIEFGIRGVDGQKIVKGTLNDILRIKNFIGPDEVYNAQIFRSPIGSGSPVIPVAIFDGALSYLNFRESVKAKAKIVLLDKTESAFEEARSVVNSEILRSKNKIDLGLNRENVPASIELISYEVPL